MLTIIIGGSGSGKSQYAEELVTKEKEEYLYYIATMEAFDDESKDRIKKHQNMRKDKGFETIECSVGIASISVRKDSIILLECLSNLVANEMFSESGAKENTILAIQNGIENLLKQSKHLVIVTNNIYEDGMEYDSTTEEYKKQLGILNEWLGKKANQVFEVVHGIEIKIK